MQNTQKFQQFSPCLSAQRIDFEMTRFVLTKWEEGKPEQNTKLLQNTKTQIHDLTQHVRFDSGLKI